MGVAERSALRLRFGRGSVHAVVEAWLSLVPGLWVGLALLGGFSFCCRGGATCFACLTGVQRGGRVDACFLGVLLRPLLRMLRILGDACVGMVEGVGIAAATVPLS